MVNRMIIEIGKKAKQANAVLSNANSNTKSQALLNGAKAIRDNKEIIKEENKKDIEFGRSKNLSNAMIDRLMLNDERIEGMAKGLEDIAQLPDPVGRVMEEWDRPNGLKIARVSIPIGVIGIIYESRPNVTADAGGLCIKSGNCAILRGGSESFHSSSAIIECIRKGLEEAGLPKDIIQLIPTRDREAVGEMLRMTEYIDVIVPRGGKGLIKRVVEESRIPTLQHLDGNCHTYIHQDADLKMATEVVKNAKLRRPGICGATESLVVDNEIAQKVIPLIADALENCEIRGDETACKIDSRIKPANDDDWDREYLDAIVSLKVVSGIDEAIDFVSTHSSGHTDAIITDSGEATEKFLKEINSAIVMHNTSTQFADGGEFGMGAEIGISTGKLHARGPVGAQQLTTFKYVVKGQGQTRP